MTPENFELLVSGLEEFTDQNFQEEVWLAKRPGVMSFFDEAFATTFDDSGFSAELDEAEKSSFAPEALTLGIELQEALRNVPYALPQDEIIRHPTMVAVRSLAAKLLEELKRHPSECQKIADMVAMLKRGESFLPPK